MKRIGRYVVFLLIILGLVAPLNVFAEPVIDKISEEVVVEQFIKVSPLEVVSNPNVYLDKIIRMDAKFDKFSTLGLDYPPAMRASADYISFMVYRDDTTFEIPLSEMKLFITRDEAQKFAELKSKDSIQITGKVFSTALGDPWIDVTELKTVNK